MEIEVGEYVRTKKDGIVKLLDYEIDGSGLWCGTVDKAFWLRRENIVKYSSNLIELIEVGDIIEYKINKLSASKIGQVKPYKDARSFKEYLGVEGFGLKQVEIISVLAKEQFENMKYIVGGENEKY